MKRTEILTAVMGAVIALTGLYFILDYYLGFDETMVSGELLSYVMLVIGGSCVVVFFRKNLRNGTIAGMITIGAATIVGRLYYLLVSMDPF